MTEAALLEAARDGSTGSPPTPASTSSPAERLARALDGDRIKEITAFVVRPANTPDGYSRWPEYAADPNRVQSVFDCFGLPDRLD